VKKANQNVHFELLHVNFGSKQSARISRILCRFHAQKMWTPIIHFANDGCPYLSICQFVRTFQGGTVANLSDIGKLRRTENMQKVGVHKLRRETSSLRNHAKSGVSISYSHSCRQKSSQDRTSAEFCFIDYNLGLFDKIVDEAKSMGKNPFAPKVLPMSPV